MAELTVRLLKRGLSDAERETLTLDDIRKDRLEAYRDGVPVRRPEYRSGTKEDPPPVTSAPTLEHMATALQTPCSSLRSYVSGRNIPRMTVSDMIDFANQLGLTVEELGQVIQNTMRDRVERQAQES